MFVFFKTIIDAVTDTENGLFKRSAAERVNSFPDDKETEKEKEDRGDDKDKTTDKRSDEKNIDKNIDEKMKLDENWKKDYGNLDEIEGDKIVDEETKVTYLQAVKRHNPKLEVVPP